jgi:hypothetical protein
MILGIDSNKPENIPRRIPEVWCPTYEGVHFFGVYSTEVKLDYYHLASLILSSIF